MNDEWPMLASIVIIMGLIAIVGIIYLKGKTDG